MTVKFKQFYPIANKNDLIEDVCVGTTIYLRAEYDDKTDPIPHKWCRISNISLLPVTFDLNRNLFSHDSYKFNDDVKYTNDNKHEETFQIRSNTHGALASYKYYVVKNPYFQVMPKIHAVYKSECQPIPDTYAPGTTFKKVDEHTVIIEEIFHNSTKLKAEMSFLMNIFNIPIQIGVSNKNEYIKSISSKENNKNSIEMPVPLDRYYIETMVKFRFDIKLKKIWSLDQGISWEESDQIIPIEIWRWINTYSKSEQTIDKNYDKLKKKIGSKYTNDVKKWLEQKLQMI